MSSKTSARGSNAIRRSVGGQPRNGPSRPRSAACSGVRVVERMDQRVPGKGRALDADRELDDALQRLEVAELDLGAVLDVTHLAVVVDRHHPLEPADQSANLGDRLAFD